MRLKPATFAIVAAFLPCLFPGAPSGVRGAGAVPADAAVRMRALAGSTKGAASLVIELVIDRRYHINSNRPRQGHLIPTGVEIEPVAGVAFDEPAFPEPAVKKLPFSDTPMSVYEGTVRITVGVRPSPGFAPKEILAKGRVRFQACDHNSCLPPVRRPFSVSVPLAPSSSPSGATAGGGAGAAAPAGGDAAGGTPGDGADFGRRGLPLNLLLAFVGGLALNLTPCVYPLIPVTLAWFGGQSGGRKGSLIGHAAAYVLGMAVTYSVLGVAAALTGGLFGGALRYPAVPAALALFMAILALGMFDVYELRVPSFLTRLVGSAGGDGRGGWTGSLLMGLTMGVVAAPCIGPFVLGLLTYVGERGDALVGFLLFFALALGLGLPFLALGVFSGSVRRLPRSGAWMVWVRRVFGFVLFGMAAYFLRTLLPPLAYPSALGLILVLGGVYLAWLAPVPDAGRAFLVARNAVGCLFFVAALYVLATGVPAALERGGAGVPGGAARDAVRWEPYSKERLARAAEERTPVFIDFYADWCAPCRELDEKTYSDPEVVRRSRGFVMVKADLTDDDDPEVRALMERFRIRGVPTLVFLRPDGEELPGLRGVGFEPAAAFGARMDQALRAQRE
ncbi:MAG: thioredoxin family protein [Acidobacteriota bacterium]|nr:thioredoxin family protein [Acidobacteriota bacterium]